MAIHIMHAFCLLLLSWAIVCDSSIVELNLSSDSPSPPSSSSPGPTAPVLLQTMSKEGMSLGTAQRSCSKLSAHACEASAECESAQLGSQAFCTATGTSQSLLQTRNEAVAVIEHGVPSSPPRNRRRRRYRRSQQQQQQEQPQPQSQQLPLGMPPGPPGPPNGQYAQMQPPPPPPPAGSMPMQQMSPYPPTPSNGGVMQPPAYPPPPSPMGMGMAMDNGMGMGMHANGNMQTKARASRGRARRLQNTKRQHLQKLQNIAAKNTVQAEKHEKNCDKASTYVETLDKDAVSCHALGANCHNNTDCAWCNGRFCALSEYCTDPDVLYQLSLEKICGRSEKEIKRAQQETNKVEIQSRVNEEMKKKGIVD